MSLLHETKNETTVHKIQSRLLLPTNLSLIKKVTVFWQTQQSKMKKHNKLGMMILEAATRLHSNQITKTPITDGLKMI